MALTQNLQLFFNFYTHNLHCCEMSLALNRFVRNVFFAKFSGTALVPKIASYLDKNCDQQYLLGTRRMTTFSPISVPNLSLLSLFRPLSTLVGTRNLFDGSSFRINCWSDLNETLESFDSNSVTQDNKLSLLKNCKSFLSDPSEDGSDALDKEAIRSKLQSFVLKSAFDPLSSLPVVIESLQIVQLISRQEFYLPTVHDRRTLDEGLWNLMYHQMFTKHQNVELIQVVCALFQNSRTEIPFDTNNDFLENVIFKTLHVNEFEPEVVKAIFTMMNKLLKYTTYEDPTTKQVEKFHHPMHKHVEAFYSLNTHDLDENITKALITHPQHNAIAEQTLELLLRYAEHNWKNYYHNLPNPLQDSEIVKHLEPYLLPQAYSYAVIERACELIAMLCRQEIKNRDYFAAKTNIPQYLVLLHTSFNAFDTTEPRRHVANAAYFAMAYLCMSFSKMPYVDPIYVDLFDEAMFGPSDE